MVKIILTALLGTTLVSCSSGLTPFKTYTEDYPINKENVLKVTEVSKDDFKKTTFLTPKERWISLDRRSSGINLNPYVGILHRKEGRKKYLRLSISYKSTDWIFLNSVHLICDNGFEYKASFNNLKATKENQGSFIREKIDISITEKNVKKISQCQSGKVRALGKAGKRDQELDPKDIIYFKEALVIFNEVTLKEAWNTIAK